MQLSKHFTLQEFTRSEKARELGIDNTPNASELANLKLLVSDCLEPVRALLNQPMIVSSGGRVHQLNVAVGGSETSDHRRWLAADFTCPRFGNPREVCEAIAGSSVKFDQLIYEQRPNRDGTVTRWVHLGYGPRLRRQIMSWSPVMRFVNGVIDLER